MRLFRHPNEVTPECKGAAIALGNFDGVHLGHQAVIARAFELAQAYDSGVGVLTFEPHPRAFFKPDQPPFRLTPFRLKMRILQALGQERDMGLDFVCCLAFDQQLASMTASEFAQVVLHDSLRAAHIVVGEDFCFGKGRSGDVTTLKKLGQELKFGVDAVSAAVDGKGAVHSSTLAREHLQAGRPQAAAQILGRAWEIAGRVEHGQKLGRKLGFPTANITLGDFLLPKLGIYAVRVALDESGQPHWIDGVASLGYRPTVGGEQIHFEVYLFDYSGDLYGRHLRVAMLEFLRPELKFPGLDELKAQIAADCDQARQFLAQYQGPKPGPLGSGQFTI
ncbi:MAG TPA: bifunctional riboflavin kinase/FAD synthetase [Dongiaceae bacterium]|nr:bifunctional riboflavin kinase/FAD synthetase [Dongiaceae bacterium]